MTERMITADDDILSRLKVALEGRYVVERLLGEGGMGRVYLGLDEALQRRVAIKVIRHDHASRPAARERFLQEARVVAALRHPAIVTVFAAGEHDGLLWFAMEFVEGESLRDLLTREGRLPADRVHAMLAELAGALDAAHRRGVVHRDVKPENILVEHDSGRVRLADFGVARALEADAQHTGTGIILGSPRYMSPEQVSGDASIDGRADLYALALVGHEMLAGRPVVQATHPSAMLVEQLTTPAPPVRSVVPDVPAELADAIDGALAKHADGRWGDARAMLQAMGVTPAGNSTGGGVTGGSGALRLRSVRRTRQRTWLAVAAVVLAAAGVGAGLWWRAREAATSRGLVVLPFDVPSSLTDQTWLREGAVNMLTLDLAQWRDVDVVDYERTLDLVREVESGEGRITLSQATAVARRADAAGFIMGQVTPGRDSLLVVARRYDRRGALRRTVQLSMARTADPRATFDQLAVRLLDLPPSGSLIALTSATTSSLQAYRDYLEGLQALNRWQLTRADSLFTEAVQRDSTFALAWYKRGIARGWNGFGDTTPSSAEIALRHAARLPERERHYVAGHRWLWSALDEVVPDTTRLRFYLNAIREYRGGVAREGAPAEAWYGLADALWHFAQFRQDTSAYGTLIAEAQAGFERALEVDPTMHLAYSHLVELHRQLGADVARWIVRGTTVVPESTWTDSTGRRAARAASRQRMLEVAQRWTVADPDAPRSWQAMGDALALIGRPDSAARLARAVDARLGADADGLGLRAAYWDYIAASPDLARHLRATLGSGPLRWWQGSRANAQGLLAFATGLAAGGGDGALVDDIIAVWARQNAIDAADPTVMRSGNLQHPSLSERHAWRTLLEPWWTTILRGAIGEPVTAATRAELARVTRAAASRFRANVFDRSWLLGSAYAAFMLTGDTVHAAFVRQLDATGPYPELDAALHLARGDTARAREVRRTFATVARVRGSNLGLAGLRSQQRVLVLLALGDSTEALAQHLAIEPARFNINALEPGLAWYVRSLALRATLAERLGQRDVAIAAWRELLQRWTVDDPRTAAVRAEARAALTRLTR